MRQIESVRRSGNFDRAREKAARRLADEMEPGRSPALATRATGRPAERIEAAVENVARASPEEFASYRGLDARAEAIVLAELRPPYFIKNDKIEIIGDFDHIDLVRDKKAALERIARNVGRVDLLHHPTYDFVGTGWLIEKDIVVTNRHVAEIFAEADWTGDYRPLPGTGRDPLEALVDYVRQHQTDADPRKAFVTEVLYIAGPREPDIAFMRVQALEGAKPLTLADRRAEVDQPVAAVGYPAWDGDRNDPGLMADLFGGIYNVKRFSPGLVTGLDADGVTLLADYTSLGGNSGSAVIDLASGEVVGLHFAGAFRQANYSVAADIVAAALLRTQSRRFSMGGQEPPVETPASAAADLSARKGYNAQFLGTGELKVPLPKVGDWKDDIAPVDGNRSGVIEYEHFSVVQSASRRLPLLTAVNIDGERQRKLGREGEWRTDARVSLDHQIDNRLYRNNALDRGHMVRRRDPGWGSDEEAQRGEADTFHYTNCVPQHEDLNQKDWVRLEDYLLGAAETRGFKASVFTGPVLRESDRRLKKQPGAEDIQIPEEFWKVAVMINADTDKLHATAYVLSHGPLIRKLTEAAFVFGKHETYQVPIALVEEATGLDFGRLREFDPLRRTAEGRAAAVPRAQRIGGPGDLVL